MTAKRIILMLTAILMLFTGCRQKPPEENWEQIQQAVHTFSDGTVVGLWRKGLMSMNVYRLSDGTELLIEDDYAGPEQVSVIGLEGFDHLSEPAQRRVSAYYQEQGLLYDIAALLEHAYAQYLSCQKSGTEFHTQRVGQAISPTAANKRTMCFLTTVTLPVEGQIMRELRLNAMFDRETGEQYSMWELFQITEEEARAWILDAFKPENPTLRAEMEAALKPEYITLHPDSMEVVFPEGTLPSIPQMTGAGWDKAELRGILHDWAFDTTGE